MSQVFHRSTNTLARISIFGALIAVGGLLYALDLVNRSAYVTNAGIAREQPVPFSHKHHAGELGIDCRYCHTSVERSSKAGVPPIQTCMNCHSQMWSDSPTLEPVRSAWRTGQSIEWIKVYDLPDFVYFNHSIHVAKGMACEVCHGRIDEMNLTRQHPSLQMEWCLDCHRHPENYIRPREEVFKMGYEPAGDQVSLGMELMKTYDVHAKTDCYICHR